MEKLRSDRLRPARLRLGKESLRRLGVVELASIYGGDAAPGDRVAPALIDDRRTMDMCPALPFERTAPLSGRDDG